MNCDTRQEQAGLLMDGDLPESSQPAVFGHLEGCSDCRGFLDSMIRLRMSARMDHENLLLAADQILPDWSPPAVESLPAPVRPWREIFATRWRVPVPAAVVLGVILLAGGAILGSRFGFSGSGPGAGWSSEPAVVVVCGMPPVDVVALNPER